MKKDLLLVLILINVIVAKPAFSQWQKCIGLERQYISSLIVKGNNIFAGTENGIFISTNNGDNWSETAPLYNWIFSLTCNENSIFSGTELELFHSTNNGNNWTRTGWNYYIGVSALSINGNSIIAGTSGIGICISTNNGSNWVFGNFPLDYVYTLTSNMYFSFAGNNDGVYRSTDKGFVWTLTGLNIPTISLVSNGSNIYAGTDHSGVYFSSNNGTSWFPTALDTGVVTSLEINGSILVAGFDHGGIYLSSDNGMNWAQKNQGFDTLPTIYSLKIFNNYIYAGTYGNSLWCRPLSEMIGIQNISMEVPAAFSLSQNYPNPFNPSTTIKFSIPKSSAIKLTIFDITGRELEVLVNETLAAGTYQTEWNASSYSSGIYFYKLQSGNYSETKRMILVK